MSPMEEIRERLDQMLSLKKRLRLKETYIRVFESPDGGAVLRDIIKRSGVFSVTTETDPILSARLEGRRALMLEILSMTRMADESAMLKLLNERHDNREERDHER